jgi:hypothetical protein
MSLFSLLYNLRTLTDFKLHSYTKIRNDWTVPFDGFDPFIEKLDRIKNIGSIKDYNNFFYTLNKCHH